MKAIILLAMHFSLTPAQVQIVREDARNSFKIDSIKYTGGKSFEIVAYGKYCEIDDVGFMENVIGGETIIDDTTYNAIEACFN